jgi:hypothetical protein
VIGVVADARINGLKDDAAMVYLPYWAFTPVDAVVSGAQRATQRCADSRDAARHLADRSAGRHSHAQVHGRTGQRFGGRTDRFQAMVLSELRRGRLLLALLGVYGVLAYSVSLRRQEFGIRIALGSGKSALIGLVLRAGCVSRSAWHRHWTHDGADCSALGPQPAVSNAGHGPARGRRQRPAAFGCRPPRAGSAIVLFLSNG